MNHRNTDTKERVWKGGNLEKYSELPQLWLCRSKNPRSSTCSAHSPKELLSDNLHPGSPSSFPSLTHARDPLQDSQLALPSWVSELTRRQAAERHPQSNTSFSRSANVHARLPLLCLPLSPRRGSSDADVVDAGSSGRFWSLEDVPDS